MKNKKANSVGIGILISSRTLLKKIHISLLSIEVGIKLIAQADKEPVLVKVVVYNFLPMFINTSSIKAKNGVFATSFFPFNGTNSDKLYCIR